MTEPTVPPSPAPTTPEAGASQPSPAPQASSPTFFTPVLSLWQRHKPLMIAGIIVVIGIIVIANIRSATQKPQITMTPTPTTTMTPTPTPIRTLSPFATTSAFISLETSVASVAASVKTYNTSDPSLSPPILDLPLGF